MRTMRKRSYCKRDPPWTRDQAPRSKPALECVKGKVKERKLKHGTFQGEGHVGCCVTIGRMVCSVEGKETGVASVSRSGVGCGGVG